MRANGRRNQGASRADEATAGPGRKPRASGKRRRPPPRKRGRSRSRGPKRSGRASTRGRNDGPARKPRRETEPPVRTIMSASRFGMNRLPKGPGRGLMTPSATVTRRARARRSAERGAAMLPTDARSAPSPAPPPARPPPVGLSSPCRAVTMNVSEISSLQRAWRTTASTPRRLSACRSASATRRSRHRHALHRVEPAAHVQAPRAQLLPQQAHRRHQTRAQAVAPLRIQRQRAPGGGQRRRWRRAAVDQRLAARGLTLVDEAARARHHRQRRAERLRQRRHQHHVVLVREPEGAREPPPPRPYGVSADGASP